MNAARTVIRAGAIAIAALLVVGGQSPAGAATKAGDSCKKVGQTKTIKSNKGELVCLKVAGARTWVYVPLAKNKAQATKATKDWQSPASLPNEDVIGHFAANSDAYISERITLAQQQRDQLAQQSALLTSQRATLQAEVTSLPSQVSSARSVMQSAQAKLDEPKKAAQAASSKASSLASEYYRLQDQLTTHVACRVLEDFGFYPPGSCGSFDNSYYSYVSSSYSAAQAQADSLWATYTSYYNDYKAKYDEYKRLYDRQAAAQRDLNTANAELVAVNASLSSAEAHLKASHDANGQLQALRAAFARWQASTSKLEQLASKKLRANWQPQYQRVARLSGMSQLHRASVIDAFAAFRSLTADLPDPPPVGTEQGGSAEAPVSPSPD